MVVLAGSSLATRVTNVVNLDDGTCGLNLQTGSDKTASKSNRPSFLLWGDGGLSSYADLHRRRLDRHLQLRRVRQRLHPHPGRNALADGPHLLTGNELAPHLDASPSHR